MPVRTTAGGGGLSMLMYASDETTVMTVGVAYALAKHFWIVHAPGNTPDFNKLMFVVYAANDTAGKNTYVAIYEDGVQKVELTFAFAAGGVYTRQFAELDISGWVDEQYHIELKMKVDAGSTGHQWIWENWLKNLAP